MELDEERTTWEPLRHIIADLRRSSLYLAVLHLPLISGACLVYTTAAMAHMLLRKIRGENEPALIPKSARHIFPR